MTAASEKRIQRAEILIAGIFFWAIQLSTQRGDTDATRATTLFVTSPGTSAAVPVAGTVTPCVCLLLVVSTLASFLLPARGCVTSGQFFFVTNQPQIGTPRTLSGLGTDTCLTNSARGGFVRFVFLPAKRRPRVIQYRRKSASGFSITFHESSSANFRKDAASWTSRALQPYRQKTG